MNEVRKRAITDRNGLKIDTIERIRKIINYDVSNINELNTVDSKIIFASLLVELVKDIKDVFKFNENEIIDMIENGAMKIYWIEAERKFAGIIHNQ